MRHFHYIPIGTELCNVDMEENDDLTYYGINICSLKKGTEKEIRNYYRHHRIAHMSIIDYNIRP
jgi:hypothetical protein